MRKLFCMISKTDKLFIIFLVGTLCFACSKKFDPKNYQPVVSQMPMRSDKDVKAPTVLIDKIEKDYLLNYKKLHPDSTLTDAQILAAIPRKYLSFDVYIRPASNKLAFSDTIHIPFARGGGYVDFSTIVTGRVGSFYLNMLFNWQEMKLEEEDLNSMKIYFLSHSLRRQIDGESWGSGCNKFLELTHFFKKKVVKKGLLLNATEQRYLSSLAGIFYFVLIKQSELFLATVTFEDSRYKDWMCKS